MARYSLSDITGLKESYAVSPGADNGIGQVVFALNMCAGSICMGMCAPGCQLVPWGICCYFNPYVNSACSSQSCTTCGFCLCGTGTFVALGAVGGCGATLWRRVL
jgi:hypothetical protein